MRATPRTDQKEECVRRSRLLPGALVGLLALGLSSSAAAQSYSEKKGMDERFRLDLGGFFQNFDTTVRLDSPSLGEGTEIDFENDLGQADHQTSFRAEGYYRFGRHGGLAFGFLTGSRSTSHTLSRDIQFGDHVYHVGATADSKMRLSQADLYYFYSFINNGEAEFGLQLGFSGLFFSTELSASGNVTGPGGATSGGRSTDSRSVLAPIPALGGYFRYTLSPRFFVSARVKGLPKVTIDIYSGSMVDARAALDYYFSHNWGIGGGYSYTKITFAREATNTLTVDYKYSGPIFYLTMAF